MSYFTFAPFATESVIVISRGAVSTNQTQLLVGAFVGRRGRGGRHPLLLGGDIVVRIVSFDFDLQIWIVSRRRRVQPQARRLLKSAEHPGGGQGMHTAGGTCGKRRQSPEGELRPAVRHSYPHGAWPRSNAAQRKPAPCL